MVEIPSAAAVLPPQHALGQELSLLTFARGAPRHCANRGSKPGYRRAVRRTRCRENHERPRCRQNKARRIRAHLRLRSLLDVRPAINAPWRDAICASGGTDASKVLHGRPLLAHPRRQPKSAFSHFPLVRIADLEGQRTVDLFPCRPANQ